MSMLEILTDERHDQTVSLFFQHRDPISTTRVEPIAETLQRV